MIDAVYLGLNMFTRDYKCSSLFTRVYLCLPLFSSACLPTFTHVYPYLPKFSLVYLSYCLLVFTCFSCLPMFTTLVVHVCIFLSIITSVYLFTLVYLC